MKLNNIIKGLSAAALVAAATTSAHAELVVLDAWQLVTPNSNGAAGTPSLTQNIGRLTLSNGTANVEQQITGGQVQVGSQFREMGAVYTITYVKDNAIGIGDTQVGFPTNLPDSLVINFSNVRGTVVSVGANGSFGYTFNSGDFSIADQYSSPLASGTILGIGGNVNGTPIVGGTAGDSTLLANVTSSAAGFDFRDSSGASLLPQLLNGSVFFEATTTNTISGDIKQTAACSFDASLTCAKFSASSDGQAYLVQAVPEPGSIALVGLALGGLGLTRLRGKRRSV